MTSCAGVYDWYAAYSLGQVAVRLESVLDSSKRPLYAVHGMQDNALSFHKSLNIACANTGAAQWTALCTGLHPQVLQAVDALRAAALPPGSSFNMLLCPVWQSTGSFPPHSTLQWAPLKC